MPVAQARLNRRRARQFTRWFLLVAAAPYGMLVVLSIALNMEPFQGDLTRIAGLPEREYGWRGQQEVMAAPGHLAIAEPVYDHYADVVVIGDSFSYLPSPAPWQAYLYRSTGWSIVTYSISKPGTLDTLLASEGFWRHPPRVLVLQSVERELARRFGKPTAPPRWQPDPPWAPLAIRPTATESRWEGRLDGVPPLRVNLEETTHVLSKQFQRTILGQADPQVAVIPLARPAALSSRRTHELLALRDDLSKSAWTPDTLVAIRDQVLSLRQRVQANGRTAFVFMVAPDKSTVYAEDAADPALRKLSPLDRIATDARLPMPRLDRVLRQEARLAQDVYLPNNTHWGYRGHKAAAETLLEHLRSRGVAAGKD